MSKWSPSKGREIQDIVDKLNELIEAVNSQSVEEGGVKKTQNIISVKNADGTYELQIRTKEGLLVSDPSSATGFRMK